MLAFVAAITRTSTLRSVPPTGRTTLSSRTRSSFAWMSTDRVPTSSRKRTPLSASWNTPGRSASAPVKAPFFTPKSAASARFPGIVLQLMVTSGPRAFFDFAW